jgi:cell division FtsZ-interacting protein ZapD
MLLLMKIPLNLARKVREAADVLEETGLQTKFLKSLEAKQRRKTQKTRNTMQNDKR